jgi:hypothetical protein
MWDEPACSKQPEKNMRNYNINYKILSLSTFVGDESEIINPEVMINH